MVKSRINVLKSVPCTACLSTKLRSSKCKSAVVSTKDYSWIVIRALTGFTQEERLRRPKVCPIFERDRNLKRVMRPEIRETIRTNIQKGKHRKLEDKVLVLIPLGHIVCREQQLEVCK